MKKEKRPQLPSVNEVEQIAHRLSYFWKFYQGNQQRNVRLQKFYSKLKLYGRQRLK